VTQKIVAALMKSARAFNAVRRLQDMRYHSRFSINDFCSKRPMMRAIVTGHTRGLGAAIAENLLSRNIKVLGVSRGRNAELEKQFADLFEQVELDLSDSAAVTNWLGGEGLQQFLSGSPAVLLVNNAGTVQPVGPLASQDVAAIARAVALNVATPLMLASAVAAVADPADKRILHISSGAGSGAVPGWSIYGATKAALNHHAQNVVQDRSRGLRICSLAPGIIDTDMQAEIRTTSAERFPLREKFEAFKREGDLSNPKERAVDIVDYLLSERFGERPVADIRELLE
jgi:benzil reductase ((S)-benzoin forming)